MTPARFGSRKTERPLVVIAYREAGLRRLRVLVACLRWVVIRAGGGYSANDLHHYGDADGSQNPFIVWRELLLEIIAEEFGRSGSKKGDQRETDSPDCVRFPSAARVFG